jgi:RNA polymerase sigma factor (sigma-70 family)
MPTTPALDVELLRRRDPIMTEHFMEVLRRFTRRYFRTPAEADEVAHDAILELLNKLMRGDEPLEAKVWALTAASNATKRALSRRSKAQAQVQYVSLIHTEPPEITMSELARCRALLRRIERLLADMPAKLRHAIYATAVEGRTISSVARELRMRSATLRKDVSRGRHRLQVELTNEEKIDRLREFVRRVKESRGHSSAPPFPRAQKPGGSTTKR